MLGASSKTMEMPDIYLDHNYRMYHRPGTSMGSMTHTHASTVISCALCSGLSQADGAPEEVLEMTHEYWTTFPPSHPAVQHFTGLIFFLLWVVSIAGNSLVIYIFLK